MSQSVCSVRATEKKLAEREQSTNSLRPRIDGIATRAMANDNPWPVASRDQASVVISEENLVSMFKAKCDVLECENLDLQEKLVDAVNAVQSIRLEYESFFLEYENFKHSDALLALASAKQVQQAARNLQVQRDTAMEELHNSLLLLGQTQKERDDAKCKCQLLSHEKEEMVALIEELEINRRQQQERLASLQRAEEEKQCPQQSEDYLEIQLQDLQVQRDTALEELRNSLILLRQTQDERDDAKCKCQSLSQEKVEMVAAIDMLQKSQMRQQESLASLQRAEPEKQYPQQSEKVVFTSQAGNAMLENNFSVRKAAQSMPQNPEGRLPNSACSKDSKPAVVIARMPSNVSVGNAHDSQRLPTYAVADPHKTQATSFPSGHGTPISAPSKVSKPAVVLACLPGVPKEVV